MKRRAMTDVVLSVASLTLMTSMAAAQPLKLTAGQLELVWGGASIGQGNGNGNGNTGNGNGNENSGNDNGNGNVGSGNGNGNSGNYNGNNNFGDNNGNGNATSGNGNGMVGNGQGNATTVTPNASMSNSVAMTSAPALTTAGVSGFTASHGAQGFGVTSGGFSGTAGPSNFGALGQSFSAPGLGGAFSMMQGINPAMSGAGSMR
jgi:hypothetical protein